MTHAQSAAIVAATHHPDGATPVPSVDDYREACADLADFHQNACAAFALALAPTWLGQTARCTAVLTGEC